MNSNAQETHNPDTFIGIDVSKDTLDVVCIPNKVHKQFKNTPAGHKALIKWLPQSPVRIILEATGAYHRELTLKLEEAQLPVVVANPRQTKYYAKAIGKLAKTDTIDALTLALYGQQVMPKLRPPKNKQTRELEDLIRRRSQLVEMSVMEKNRSHQVSDKINASVQTHINYLKSQIKELELLIKQHIKQFDDLSQIYALLKDIPGIGDVCATTLIASLPELGHVNRKQIATLVGVAPLNCDSGQYSGKRFIWGGRTAVRNALYMATIAAIRANTLIKPFYNKLIQAGKPTKVALTACMRKLLMLMNSMLKYQKTWAEFIS